MNRCRFDRAVERERAVAKGGCEEGGRWLECRSGGESDFVIVHGSRAMLLLCQAVAA